MTKKFCLHNLFVVSALISAPFSHQYANDPHHIVVHIDHFQWDSSI